MQPTVFHSPCKGFNKKKSLACYKLIFEPDPPCLRHYEIFRVVNQTPGEYYVLPIETLQKQVNHHYSYHKSGAFHWRHGTERIRPLCGESDARCAALMVQAMGHLTGKLDGYCFARGRDITEENLVAMVEILDGYIIPPLKQINIASDLKDRHTTAIFMMGSPYQVLADAIIESGKFSYDLLSTEEIDSLLKAELPNGRQIRLEPRSKHYMCPSEELLKVLLKIATLLLDEKLKNKPSAFWTRGLILNEAA